MSVLKYIAVLVVRDLFFLSFVLLTNFANTVTHTAIIVFGEEHLAPYGALRNVTDHLSLPPPIIEFLQAVF